MADSIVQPIEELDAIKEFDRHGINGPKYKSRFKMSKRAEQRLVIALFSIVPVAFLLTFTYLPVVRMLQYSVTDWNGMSPTSNFVGLSNYLEIFTRPRYLQVFRVSLFYFAGTIVQQLLALLLATILTFKVKFQNFFKGVIFFPYLINGVAIGFMFLYFFRPSGTLDSVLNLIGLGSLQQAWLGNPNLINWSMAFTSVWRYLGFSFLITFGAIQAIDSQVYEAAAIDGANKWHQFRYIILPSIRPIIVLNMILGISGSLSAFEIPFIMTGGSNGSTTFVIQTVNTAFQFRRLGMASAMAVVLLLIVGIVTIIQRLIAARWEKE